MKCMNRRGQNVNLPEIVGGILGIILVMGFISILPSLLNPCSEQNAKIDQLQNELNSCRSLLQNQTELEQKLNQECNDKITQATSECENNLGINVNIVNSYRFMFLIYHISIALSIILGLNLFKGFLRFELEIKNKKLKMIFKGVKFVWVTFKWFAFIASILIFIFVLLFLFFPHWFS